MSRRHKEKQAAMQRKRTAGFALGVGAAALVAGLAAASLLAGPAGDKDAAPSFVLADSEGGTVSLGGFAGKPLVLFFMTSSDWCAPCWAETKGPLRQLAGSHEGSVGMLSLEMVPDRTDADLNAFKAETGAAWSHAKDTREVASSYGVLALSTVVVVSPDQRIAWRGADPSYEQLIRVVEPILE